MTPEGGQALSNNSHQSGDSPIVIQRGSLPRIGKGKGNNNPRGIGSDGGEARLGI